MLEIRQKRHNRLRGKKGCGWKEKTKRTNESKLGTRRAVLQKQKKSGKLTGEGPVAFFEKNK